MRRVVALALVAAAVLTGCTDGQKEGENAEMKIQLGKAFEWNGFKAEEGWRLESEKVVRGGQEVMQPDITGLVVTNTGENTRFALFRIGFFQGKDQLAVINCSSDNKLTPGDRAPMNCPGLGAVFPTEYDSVLIGELQR